jgi:hypothetical protein
MESVVKEVAESAPTHHLSSAPEPYRAYFELNEVCLTMWMNCAAVRFEANNKSDQYTTNEVTNIVRQEVRNRSRALQNRSLVVNYLLGRSRIGGVRIDGPPRYRNGRPERRRMFTTRTLDCSVYDLVDILLSEMRRPESEII